MPFTEYTFNAENPVDRIFYGRIAIKKAASFLFYRQNGIVQRLIHQLKYKNHPEISAFLGDWYGQLLRRDEGLDQHIDMVIPVPLHRKKQRARGYNQVSGFAQRLAKHLDAEYHDALLVKTANTKTQTTKGRIGRWLTNKALYTVTQKMPLKNKRILLVDDVITTGATMETCARTLTEIPGTTVYIASMAVVPLP
ncbi:ComF family protein [Maribacter sp. 2-571]|uniref:ComF family protein n=1 Tax=Maribacter sp. 2-571 TaxID=3417569 RepID=UPI003D327976